MIYYWRFRITDREEVLIYLFIVQSEYRKILSGVQVSPFLFVSKINLFLFFSEPLYVGILPPEFLNTIYLMVFYVITNYAALFIGLPMNTGFQYWVQGLNNISFLMNTNTNLMTRVYRKMWTIIPSLLMLHWLFEIL